MPHVTLLHLGERKMTYALVIGGCLAIAAIFLAIEAIRIYNRLVKLDKHCDNGFSQIEVQLKRRYDLIPNLVETVKGYMEHEKDTLERVISARNSAAKGLSEMGKGGAKGAAMSNWMGAEGMLTNALGKMNFVMEAYPELKANESVASLTEELRSTENKIAFARQAFNDWCTAFNLYRESFPAVALASSFGFDTERQLLEYDESENIQAAPQVALTS